MSMQWTAEQQKVIELRNRNILVSAAAGSGKTAVLVERIIRMLTDEAHPVDVDRLLIVTFTEAAAAEMKERIVEGAKEAVEGFKRTGVKALDHAVSALGIKKALESIQKGIGESIADVKKSIEKVESLGHELRSAGGHMKNAGRALIGKEQQAVDGGSEGRFQAAVLSPLRMEKTILNQLNNMALAAIGNMERLEQAAGHTREDAIPEAGQEEPEEHLEAADLDDLEPSPDKGKEKPSVLKDLQEKKAQAAARPSPAPEKEKKVHEAAL